MYQNPNSRNTKYGKRYNPSGGMDPAMRFGIILLVVFVGGFALGGIICTGIYKAVNGDGAGTHPPFGIVTTSPTETTSPSVTQPQGNPDYADKLICIDPGHGFRDKGSSSDYIGDKTESDINLAFSLKLKAALEAVGFTVKLTHDGMSIPVGFDYDGDNIFSATEVSAINGKYISERRDYAHSLNPDFFVSIHCDTFSTDAAKGMRLYYDKANAASSVASDALITYMSSLQNKYGTTTRKYPKEGNDVFVVIREWSGNTPAILAELGFITNQNDATNLLSDEWMTDAAAAYANAIADYFDNK